MKLYEVDREMLGVMSSGLLLVAIFSRGIVVDEAVGVKTAEAFGFSQVQVIDSSWFAVPLRGCGPGDAARFTLTAMNSRGEQVEVYACTGALLKAGTIRVP